MSNSSLVPMPRELTKSIVVQRVVNTETDVPVFIKMGAKELVTSAPIERNAQNSPHVIRSSFHTYLKTEFMYKLDWTHPVSKETYPHADIKTVIEQYKYIAPQNYKTLWALWTSSTNREALANLFMYSPSTIKRRWDESVDIILFMLIWPELNVAELKIYPNA